MRRTLLASLLAFGLPLLAHADEAAAPAPVAAAAAAAAPVAARPARLVGVILSSAQALLWDEERGEYVLHRVGDDAFGGRLVELDADHIVIERGEAREVMEIAAPPQMRVAGKRAPKRMPAMVISAVPERAQLAAATPAAAVAPVAVAPVAVAPAPAYVAPAPAAPAIVADNAPVGLPEPQLAPRRAGWTARATGAARRPPDVASCPRGARRRGARRRRGPAGSSGGRSGRRGRPGRPPRAASAQAAPPRSGGGRHAARACRRAGATVAAGDSPCRSPGHPVRSGDSPCRFCGQG